MNFIVRSLSELSILAKYLLDWIMLSKIISLEGTLGSGKTTFIQAIAKEMGYHETIISPTFTLLNTYIFPNNLLIHHTDWYRLTSIDEVLSLGLEECFEHGICFIEWGNKFDSLLPRGTLRIQFHTEVNMYHRAISVTYL